MATHRPDRVGDQIRQEISQLLSRGAVHDPGIGFITLTRVKVSADLQIARVFYTSMGHREDVWTNPLFQQVLLGGLSWAAGNVEADVKPNLMEVCPGVENVRKD